MAKCSSCGTIIVFGGERLGEHRFCSKNCLEAGAQSIAAAQIPNDLVWKQAEMIHAGDCPKCHGGGPVDVHHAHWVWSALVLTSHQSTAEVCCARCGRMSNIKAMVFCTLFGWWGFPWGIGITPFQLFKNLRSLMQRPTDEPSRELLAMIQADLGRRLYQ